MKYTELYAEEIAKDIHERFTKWVATVHNEMLSQDDYLAVLDWLRFCIETGDTAFIGGLTLDEIVTMIWG